MFIVLPFDNKSGSVMSCLRDLFISKSRDLDRVEQEQFDKMLGQIHLDIGIMDKIRLWTLSRIELHVAFESISQEKKNMVTMATKTALTMISSFIVSDMNYEVSIAI